MNPRSSIKQVISEVLALLFNSDSKSTVNKTLHILLDFFNADWIYIALFEQGNRVANFLYEVTSPWVDTSKEDMSELSYETIPWIIDTILSGREIILHDIEDLPESARIDRRLLTEQKLLSMLVLPLTFHGQIRGFIGFDSIRVRRYWTQAEIEDLHLIANIFSLIIERQYRQKSILESKINLLQSNTRFQMIFQNLPIGVELYDAEGSLIDTNEANVRIFGTCKRDMLGMNMFENPNLQSLVAAMQAGKNSEQSVTYSFREVREKGYYPTRLDDVVKYLKIKGLVLQKKNLGVIGYLFIITDNTENHLKEKMEKKLRLAEEEKRRTEMEMQKVREADKLKSAFLANMSHEIRTPLNAIVGFSGIMAETDNAEERQLYQEIIQKNNELLLQLISDILDFSKIESGVLDYHLAEISLKELCNEIYAICVNDKNKSVPLVYPQDELPDILLHTDAKRVTQVITNLISNAFKFTQQGSVTLAYRAEGEFVRITVTDTGIGISEEHLRHVFDRFMKVDNFSQGTGLGLPICKMIVEALHGKIGVESEPGKGSTFWFTLPLPPHD